MQKRTAEKVANLLGLVEQWIKDGRPRKMPGKPRPEAISDYGTPMKATLRNFWAIDKLSLPAAFKLAQQEEGYTKYVRDIAEEELLYEYSPWSWHHLSVADIDNEELDTRELVRAARAARRYIETTYEL